MIAGERLVSNLARFVIVIWCFVVLILTQSYTASLTSLLTVQQLLPTVTDVNSLIKNREFVGYAEGSFVFGLLKGLGFDESRLISYNSIEDCNQLFDKGSGNGGIAAAFDEVAPIKLLLAQYCSKYTTVKPTFKLAGWGFVSSLPAIFIFHSVNSCKLEGWCSFPSLVWVLIFLFLTFRSCLGVLL
uniref:Uncharacterized protein MANES_16G133600 n=1 Tax=Rhizophora mucronata TaxID=61149 RepID=A0A2P2MPZ9_RHIMU